MAFLQHRVILFTALTLLILAGAVTGYQDYTDNQRESATRWLFRRLGENPEVLQTLRAMVEQRLGHSLPDIEPAKDNSAICSGCTLALRLIKNAIHLGGTYEDMRDQVIDICKRNLPGGDLMCAGLADNYGPHVEHILRVTNKGGPLKKDARKVCEFMTHCKIDVKDPRPSTPAASTTTEATKEPQTTAASTPDTATPTAEATEAATSTAAATEAATTMSKTNEGDEHAEFQQEPLDVAWHPATDVMRGIMMSQEDDVEGRRHAHARKRRHAQRKANALKIVQVADFHIDEKYAEGSADQCEYIVCCRKDFNGNGSAGHWGEYKCNVPPRTIELFLNFTANILKPEFVIYSGDNPPHSAWEESYESQINVTQLAASLVEKNIFDRNSIKTYPAIGNHETMPTNLYTMNKTVHGERMAEFNQKWEEAWAKSAGFEAEQKDTIHKAGYYTILVKEGLRIVCLNSNYGYTDNFYNLIHWIEDEYIDMMAWFETTLKKARGAKEKVIMVSHHDIGVNIIEFDKNFTKILADYKDIIVFHPVGHTHRDEFRLYFGEDTTRPAGMLHVSMTMNSWPNVNPGFRLFYLDRDDYTVLDYDQYYLNLENATADAQPEKLYTFTEEYDLPDASADSHLLLWHKLRRDPELMKRYWDTKRLRTGADGPCNETCVIAELCQQVSQTREHFLICQQYYGDEIMNPTGPGPTYPPTEQPTQTTTEPPTTTTPEDGSGVSGIVSTPILVCLLWVMTVSMLRF